MKYQVCLIVEKNVEDDHPARWDWYELVGNKVELVSVEEVRQPTGDDDAEATR